VSLHTYQSRSCYDHCKANASSKFHLCNSQLFYSIFEKNLITTASLKRKNIFHSMSTNSIMTKDGLSPTSEKRTFFFEKIAYKECRKKKTYAFNFAFSTKGWYQVCRSMLIAARVCKRVGLIGFEPNRQILDYFIRFFGLKFSESVENFS
jgi:hypothetical protein